MQAERIPASVTEQLRPLLCGGYPDQPNAMEPARRWIVESCRAAPTCSGDTYSPIDYLMFFLLEGFRTRWWVEGVAVTAAH
jgi:hypothetical protein